MADHDYDVIVLDHHRLEDARILKHIATVEGAGHQVYHLNLNRHEPGMRCGARDGAYVIDVTPWSSGRFGRARFNIHAHSRRLLSDALNALKRMGAREGRHIIHVHDPSLLHLAKNLSRKLGDCRVVYDRHEFFDRGGRLTRGGPQIVHAFELLGRRVVSGVVTTSDEHSEATGRLYPGIPRRVINNYASKEAYDHAAVIMKIEEADRPWEFIYIGSLNSDYDRDINLIIRLYEGLRGHDVVFRVGGRSAGPDLERTMRKLHEEEGDRFYYLGEVPRREVEALTQQAHFGLLLIKPDTGYWVRTSPNKVFEYLRCGTVPIVRAMIEEEERIARCALMYDRDDNETAILNDIVSLLDDPLRIRSMMAAALEISEEYSWENVAPRYLELYEEVFKSR